VYSFVVFHRAYHPAFADEVPYVVGVVELDEGPRLLSNLVEVDPHQVHHGMRVFVKFDDRTADVAVPNFSPAEAPT
jgi:uncharacterized OB-fold protein